MKYDATVKFNCENIMLCINELEYLIEYQILIENRYLIRDVNEQGTLMVLLNKSNFYVLFLFFAVTI